jgi:hypothetical protein
MVMGRSAHIGHHARALLTFSFRGIQRGRWCACLLLAVIVRPIRSGFRDHVSVSSDTIHMHAIACALSGRRSQACGKLSALEEGTQQPKADYRATQPQGKRGPDERT